MFGRKAKQMQWVTNYRLSTKIGTFTHKIIKMPLERKGCGWVLVRQDSILFILCELFALTITSISFMKTRLIRTTINTADTNVILKQFVIIVILLSKFS